MRRFIIYLSGFLFGICIGKIISIWGDVSWLPILAMILLTLWLIYALVIKKYLTLERRQGLFIDGILRWSDMLVVTDDDMKNDELFTLVRERVYTNSDKLKEMISSGISRKSLTYMTSLYDENEYLCNSWCNLVELYESGKDYTVLYDSLIGKLEQ